MNPLKIGKIFVLNLFTFTLFIFVGEVLGRFGLQFRHDVSDKNTSPREPHSKLGHWHPRSKQIHASMYCGQNPCFKDISYRFDEAGRRIGSETKPRGRPLVILGDSSTFGFGLDYQDTVGGILERSLKRPVFNYAMNGYGPHQIYGLIRRRILQEDLPKDSDFLIVVTKSILSRGLPSVSTAGFYNSPQYTLNENKSPSIHQSGTIAFPEKYPLLLALNKIKMNSGFLKFIGFDYSPFSEEEVIAYGLSLLGETSQLIKRFFNGRVWIVEHPHSDFTDYQEKLVSQKMKELHLISFTKEEERNTDLCACDDHPNGKANKIFSQKLIEKFKFKNSP